MQRDLQQQIAKLIAQTRQVTRVERLKRLVCLLEQMRPQALVRLLPIPRAPIRRAKALGDARDGRERCEVRVRLPRRQQRESWRERLGLRSRRVVLRDQRAIELRIENEDDRPKRVEGVAIERARTDDVDASGKAREEPLEERA